MEPLISVIIPTYNRVHTIARCVESIIMQTYKNIEIIIVDDFSDDDTRSVVNTINDERVQYYCLSENSGACVARNYGINKAKGKYIAFQDSDDVWSPNKLERQLEILLTQKADIVFCSMKRIDEETNEFIDFFPNSMESHFIKSEELLKGNLVSTQTLLGRRECFLDVLFNPNMPRFQDWELAIRLLRKYSIYYSNEILVDVFLQADSISKSNVKTIVGLSNIIELNKILYLDNIEEYYNILSWLARIKVVCSENPQTVYKEMLKIRKDKKILVKYIICKFEFFLSKH